MGYFLDISIIFQETVKLAYIDPGTGSLIIQMLIGGAAAGLIALKVFWGKIRAKFSRNHTLEKTAETVKAKSRNE